MKKLLFSPGAAPNLSARCISYPKFITIAGIFLALRSSRQTNPAARQGDAPQGSPGPFSSWRARRDPAERITKSCLGAGAQLTDGLCCVTGPGGAHGDVGTCLLPLLPWLAGTETHRKAGRSQRRGGLCSGCDCATGSALFTSHADTRRSQQSPLGHSCPSLQTFLQRHG